MLPKTIVSWIQWFQGLKLSTGVHWNLLHEPAPALSRLVPSGTGSPDSPEARKLTAGCLAMAWLI